MVYYMYIACFTCVQGLEARSTDTSCRYPLCKVSNLTRQFPREQLKCRLHDEAEPWWKLDVCLYEPKARVHCKSGNGNTSCFDCSSRFFVCCFLLFVGPRRLLLFLVFSFGLSPCRFLFSRALVVRIVQRNKGQNHIRIFLSMCKSHGGSPSMLMLRTTKLSYLP